MEEKAQRIVTGYGPKVQGTYVVRHVETYRDPFDGRRIHVGRIQSRGVTVLVSRDYMGAGQPWSTDREIPNGFELIDVNLKPRLEGEVVARTKTHEVYDAATDEWLEGGFDSEREAEESASEYRSMGVDAKIREEK